jgi:hypothetical protein
VSESIPKPEIPRDPPEEVKRQLRKEVGFGCPFSHCREPFLSFHHFDPPWAKEHHHRPEGMIALCVKHHTMADRGNWDKSQLHELKKAKCSVEDVKAKFEWARTKQLIRLGGYYTTPTGTRVLQETSFPPIVTLRESEEGLLELSFALYDQNGRKLAEMEDNMFRATPPRLFDIHVDPGGTKIKIKVSKSEVILDLWSTRVTIDQLDRMARQDWERWRSHRDRLSSENPAFRTYQHVYSPDDISHPYGRRLGGADLASPIGILPSESQGEEYRDGAIEGIMKYARAYLLDEEGKVPVLDYRNLVTYFGHSYFGHYKFQVQKGIDLGGAGWGGFGCLIVRKGEGQD